MMKHGEELNIKRTKKMLVDYLKGFKGEKIDDDVVVYIRYKDGSIWHNIDHETYDYKLTNIACIIETNPSETNFYNAHIEWETDQFGDEWAHVVENDF